MGKDVVSATARGGAGAAKNLAKAGMSGAAGAVLAGGVPATQFAGDVIRAASPEQRKEFYDNPMVGAMGGDTAMASAIMNAAEEGQAQRKQKQAGIATDNRAAINKADAAMRAAPGTPAAPARDLKALAAQKELAAQKNQPRPPAAVVPPVVPTAPTVPAAPAVASDAVKMVTGRMNASPQAKKDADVAEYKKMVGEPDTAQYDRLVAELEKRKSQLEGPQDKYGQLMEYLSQISANSRPGQGSGASGAAGARALTALNKDRQLQQFDLSKQAIEVSQKKLDTVRAYAKDVYGIGKSAFDQVYKDQFDAAKELVKDENEARKLAQENTLKLLQMENNLEVQRLQNKGSLAAANVRSEGNEGKRQVEVLKAELASIDKELAPLLKVPYGTNKNKIAALEAQKAQVQKDLRAAGGVSTIAPAPGAAGPGGTSTSGWGKPQVVK
jgi:hypothetical protein